MSSKAHCRTVDRAGCWRSTIPRRRSRLMDRSVPPRNPVPHSAGRSAGKAGPRGLYRPFGVSRGCRRRCWPLPQARPSSRPESGLDGPHTGRPAGLPPPPPFTASNATLALNDALCFLRPCDTSRSSFTTDLILGAGLSLSYLSSFPGPPHSRTCMLLYWC